MTLPTDPRHGQAHIPQQYTTPAQPLPAGQASPRRRWPLIAAAAVVVLAVVGGAAYAFMPSEQDDAVDRCQSAISDQLKAPSTAKYGDVTVTSSEGNFGTFYEVSGAVDAQNGFGAMVRSEYQCKVQRESDGGWLVTESTLTQG